MPPETHSVCDCHAHVFGDQARYPLAPGADYSPGHATVDEYRAVLDSLQIARCVLVQPSVYGTDNRCLLDALEQLAPRARGVAVIAPDTPLEHLHNLHQRGVRGVRLNTLATNGPSLDQLPRFEQLIQPLGWHLQLLLREDALPAALERLETIGCPVVLDHFASCSPRTAAATLDALFELAARQTNLWIKLSAPYLFSDCSPAALEHYRAFTERGLAVMPERLLWATDWPHPALRERHPDTTRRLHERLCDWVTDARQRQRIEVSNPARLYGF